MSLEGSNRSGIRGRLFAKVGRHCVARHQLGEHEDDERDSHGEQHERRSTTEQEAQEARGGTGPTPSPRRVGDGGGRRRQGLTIVARATTPVRRRRHDFQDTFDRASGTLNRRPSGCDLRPMRLPELVQGRFFDSVEPVRALSCAVLRALRDVRLRQPLHGCGRRAWRECVECALPRSWD
jgi:hypothetical protein